MPAISLRCRSCGHEVGLDGVGACEKCWGPLEPVYDLDEIRPRLTREKIATGPPSLWRYGALLPVETPIDPRLPPGLTPLVQAPRLAEALGVRELYLKLDTANPTHSFKDRVVAVACAKAQELGLRTLACSSTGNLAGAVAARAAVEGLDAAVFCPAGLEREKLLSAAAYGATIYEVRGSYDDCSRLTVELSFELPWAFVNVNLRSYYAEGSKTVAFEIAEQLGWQPPGRRRLPGRLGSAVLQDRQGLRRVHRPWSGRGSAAAADRRPGTGLRPGRRRLPRGAAGDTGPSADDRQLARDRQPGRRRPRAGHRARLRWLDPLGARGRDRPEHAPAGRELGRLRRGGGGICVGALREALRQGTVTADDRVVVCVTGDGLKTPGPVADRFASVEIEADADALLEQLGVAV